MSYPPEGAPADEQETKRIDQEKLERARKLFMDHGYFDEVVQDLRGAISPQQRAAAARALGVVGNKRGTSHLIAAMFDKDPEVRNAAEVALAKLGGPTASNISAHARRADDSDSKKIKVVEEFSPAQRIPVSGATPQGEPEQNASDAVGIRNDIEARFPKSPVHDRGAHVPSMIESTSQKSGVDEFEIEIQQATQKMVHHESNQETEEISQEVFHGATLDQATASTIEEKLLLEERAIREKVKQLERQSLDAAAVRMELEKEAVLSVEREMRLRTEAATRRGEDEELRKQADEAGGQRKSHERDALRAEQLARAQAEKEAHRIAEEEARMRLETFDLQKAAEELVWRRIGVETARREAAEETRLAEATRLRQVAKARHEAEVTRLCSEEEALLALGDEVTRRRAEVGKAHQEAEAEIERLTKERALLAAAEAARRAETQRLLEDARRRTEVEQQQMEDEARRNAEHEERRRAELELLKKNAEIVTQQRAEEEKQILSRVDSLRIADAEARKRIEEAEARRRKAEDVYRLVAEKVQRVEAEAHLRAAEEEQILAKLEAVRRNAAVEAQVRADQEKRIKEEIELFRRLEDVERPRLEVATLQRTQAQGLFQEQRDRAKADEETRSRTDERRDLVDGQTQPSAGDEPSSLHRLDTPDEPDHTLENLEPARSRATNEHREKEAISVEGGLASGVTAAIQTYLNSVDPYKRAAAVTELARSNEKDAFDLIAKCFDDHSSHVHNAAARGLLKIDPARTVELFNRVLEDGPEDRRRKIGNAIAASGLAKEAIDNLVSDNREDTYNALSILFVMAKTGEVQPLVQAIAEHPSSEISEAAIKLLTLSGKSEIASAALKQRANARAQGRGQ